MAQHLVMCRECKQRFDAKKSEEGTIWIMPSKNWYYHIKCYDLWVENRKKGKDILSQETDEEYQKEIYDYLARCLKVPFDGGVVGSQIKTMKKKGRTVKGILFALIYYYEIKGNSWNPNYEGIWIAELVYDESRRYWAERIEKQSNILTKIEEQLKALREAPKISIKKQETRKWKSKMIEVEDEYKE